MGEVSKEVATRIIQELRWGLDMLVTNDFGERVWLGPCFHPTTGKRIGITDCCFEESPCEHHKDILASTILAPACWPPHTDERNT